MCQKWQPGTQRAAGERSDRCGVVASETSVFCDSTLVLEFTRFSLPLALTGHSAALRSRLPLTNKLVFLLLAMA